jgi:hypothetical protein
MIEGECPKCNTHSYGWALLEPPNQMCSNCGSALIINRDGRKILGFSPFTAEEYKVKALTETTIYNRKITE